MPIAYANIASDCRASLDSEGSDFYNDLLDIVPALNKAQDYLMGIILPKFGSKKFNEELFKGLIKTRIFQPSIYSRINVDQVIDSWGIISVVVNPVVSVPPAPSTTFVPVAVPNADQSAMIPTLIYVSGGQGARRLNSQEWGANAGNPFEGGYVPQPNETPAVNINYGYLSHIDNLSAIDPVMNYEITIRPFITSTTPVAITFATYPTRITGTGAGQFLDWNVVFQQFLVKATLMFIAEKTGDKITSFEVNTQELEQLIMLNS